MLKEGSGRRDRRQAARRRSTVMGSLAAMLPFLGACSTLPFAPERGPGADFTLATVGDVSERDADIRRQVESQFEARLEEAIAAAHAEDERRIGELEAARDQQEQVITALQEALTAATTQRTELAEMLAAALDELAAGSVEMQRIAQRLDAEIDRLPREALAQLNEAIALHLTRAATGEPEQGRAAATKPSSPEAVARTLESAPARVAAPERNTQTRARGTPLPAQR